ncbi:MAG: hypothetical protein AB7O62_12365 [Pirellulales bacterium]
MMSWYHAFWQTINCFGMKEWLVVLGVLFSIGFFCMKGFGSRLDC